MPRTSSTRSRVPAAEPEDPGAYIGRMPERATETIPGGVGHKDRRVSATDTQPGAESPDRDQPQGHREGERSTDDTVREAGQSR
jgi:hypothetical protein